MCSTCKWNYFTLPDKITRIFMEITFHDHIFHIYKDSKSSADFEKKYKTPSFFTLLFFPKWIINSNAFVSVCKIGYTGLNCSKQCVYPNYGWKCKLECNCSKEYCNISSGCLEKLSSKSTIVTVFIIFAMLCNCQ